MQKADEVDKIIMDVLFDFSHVWVNGFGWEKTIMVPSDFDRVSKMPFKDNDGSDIFMAYSFDLENKEIKIKKFKGNLKREI